MRNLKELIISVTNNCNLRCKMCGIPQSFKKDLISTEDFERLFKDFSEMGGCKKEVVLSGGEPLTREDIFDIISSASSFGILTYMPSNGTLINDTTAKKLRQSGIDTVNISIEGSKEIHDSIRGIGTFDKAVNAIKNLKEQNINVTIATTVMDQNYTHLPQIVELAKGLDVTTVMFQPFNKNFLPQSNKENFWINDTKELNNCIEKIIYLSNKLSIMINHKVYLKNMLSYFLNSYFPDNKHCSVIETSCAIDNKGNVYPCWPQNIMILGNVRKKNISQIWGSSQHKLIKNKIRQNKCPNACLMSCHEKNFSKNKLIDLEFYRKIKKKFKNKTFLSRKENIDVVSLNEVESVEQELERRLKKL